MKTVKGLKIGALIPLVWMALVLLAFGIGELAGGDVSGAGHFIPLIFVGLVLWFAWKNPVWGGALLLVGGILSSFRYVRSWGEGPSNWLPPLLIMILPPVLSGALLLIAGLLERKSQGAKTAQGA